MGIREHVLQIGSSGPFRHDWDLCGFAVLRHLGMLATDPLGYVAHIALLAIRTYFRERGELPHLGEHPDGEHLGFRRITP